MRCPKLAQPLLVRPCAVALAQEWMPGDVRDEPQPFQVFEQRGLELRTASDAIVILDAQQHASA